MASWLDGGVRSVTYLKRSLQRLEVKDIETIAPAKFRRSPSPTVVPVAYFLA